jgi:sodium-dependent dicarboxylate transporter 2/3/5
MLTVAIVFAALCLLSVYHRVPALENADKSAIILVSTVLFFVLRILAVKDLQELPWNLVLLFGAAMSIGFCLKETRAADWLAVQYLGLFRAASPMLFVMVTAFLVLVTINWMMNVAVIAIFVPVSLVAASQLGVAPEVMLFASLAAAGMPFMLLYGSAPNVIAYGSGLFTQGEFFKIGFQASILLMVVLGFFVWGLWPILGMPILVNP